MHESEDQHGWASHFASHRYRVDLDALTWIYLVRAGIRDAEARFRVKVVGSSEDRAGRLVRGPGSCST